MSRWALLGRDWDLLPTGRKERAVLRVGSNSVSILPSC